MKSIHELIPPLLLMLLLTGCNSSTEPQESTVIHSLAVSEITGTYKLAGFHAEYYSGTSITSSTPGYTISGKMTVAANGDMTQNFVINSTPASATSKLVRIESDSIMVLSSPTGIQRNLIGHVSGDTLTTFFKGSEVGATYDETDIWVRTSISLSKENAIFPGNQGGRIGGLGVLIAQ